MKAEEIGTLEAKTRLSALLDEVLNGKSFYLTRHGKRVAELRPIDDAARRPEAGLPKALLPISLLIFDEPLDEFKAYME